MKEPKYKYVITDKRVIAISSFAGRTVRGIAKCHPNDPFDVEYGKKLAAARCNAKIAEKRWKRARDKYNALFDCMNELVELMSDARDYLANSHKAMKEARAQLGEIE